MSRRGATRVRGLSNNESAHSRGTTRGGNDVILGQTAPEGSVVLREMVCSVCGGRSYYAPDGDAEPACPFRGTRLHRVEDALRKRGQS